MITRWISLVPSWSEVEGRSQKAPARPRPVQAPSR
jgi:hypothetical protein